jgi:hypothetical protein
VSTTAVVLLGFIAVATLVMAAVQVGLIIVALRLTKQVEALLNSIERDLRPLLLSLSTASNNVVRVTELAVSQVQRVDRMFNDVALRLDDVMRLVQATLLAPVREGRALLAALGAALGALGHTRSSRDESLPSDDDALFIG